MSTKELKREAEARKRREARKPSKKSEPKSPAMKQGELLPEKAAKKGKSRAVANLTPKDTDPPPAKRRKLDDSGE